jgi:two-component system cell cycle sensor histidine kinase/response regulator CckA
VTVIRTRAKDALKSSEQVYRSLFETNHLPMWVYDASTTEFLAVNVAAVELYGYTEEEFLGLRLVDIGADTQFEEDRAAIVDGRPLGVVGPYVNWTKDGTRIQVILRSRQIEFSGRQARFVVAEDVTERQRVQTLLDRSQRLASIGELAGGIAHDFNNILCLIAPYAEMVSEAVAPEAVVAHATDDDYWKAVRSDVGQILRAVDRGAELAFRLLAFAGREVFQPRALDVKNVMDEVAALLERSLGEQVELVVTVAPETWPVLFDPGLLEQVLLNLAVNARYALANGGTLTMTTENIHGHVSTSNHVRITVTDNGVGMTQDTLHRVFEPFFTTKPAGEGTGMGLASSYGLITRAGGTIAIASELGKGTTVTIVLPAAGEAIVPGESALPLTLEHGGEGERVLLVEDDAVLQEAIRRMLSKSGFEVFPCAEGTEALNILRRTPGRFDVLLTDVVMPKMLGPELAQLVRNEQPDIRILFMSGYAAGALGPTNRLDEGCDLLRKPFGHQQLLSKLREVLAAQSTQTELDEKSGDGGAAHGAMDLLVELGGTSAS